jgi:hypothetical protein
VLLPDVKRIVQKYNDGGKIPANNLFLQETSTRVFTEISTILSVSKNQDTLDFNT